MKKDNKGSLLVLVLVIATAAGLVLTSLSRLSMTETQFNERARLIIEAKEAAEAAVECGFAQLAHRFESRNSFPVDALKPAGGNPLILTPDFYTLFEDGGPDFISALRLPGKPYDPQIEWGTQETEMFGGQIPPGEWKFIDGRIPGNEFDPLRDKLVFSRTIEVYAKATVKSPSSERTYTAYVSQDLQVRDAPLFAHAIFYNMDMEIAPGPAMDIFGSVHANGRMFIQSNASLDFYQNVSATGKIYHGPSPSITKSTAGGSVTFTNGSGSQVSMKDGGTWIDSDISDFRSVASNRWNGNLQGYEHGIQVHNPVAIDSYEPDNPATGVNDDPLNYAYQLIQPLLDMTHADYSPEIESQKFHYKSGLVLEIDTSTNSINAYVQKHDAKGELLYDEGKPVKSSVSLAPDMVKVETFGTQGANVTTGLYDQRMRDGINLVEIDISKLAAAVDGNDSTSWGGDAAHTPSNWWTGVVYVDFPQKADAGRPDKVVPAVDGWGLKLVNGEDIPNPDFGWSKDLYGTTIATNVPMYVEGNYNADGDSGTGSAREPDVSDVRLEPPAALVADAITILSNVWNDKDSMKNTAARNSNSFTEVAAAILTGLVPSDKNGANNYSGGVENFPRFLEKWNNKFRYRGSMVALFESEVATEPWGKSNVYDPPTRDWGFNRLYAEGYYPPGTPNSRTFRRVNYRNLTGAQYKAAIEQVKAQL